MLRQRRVLRYVLLHHSAGFRKGKGGGEKPFVIFIALGHKCVIQQGDAMIFDHFAIAGADLATAAHYAETRLGQPLPAGGQHARFGTHNRLIGCRDGLYIEAIAIDPAAPPPPDPRWFDLDRFSGPPRIGNWICRVADLDAALAQFGPAAGRPVEVARGNLRWRMAVPENGILPFDNCFPALIEWIGHDHPTHHLPIMDAALKRFEICHPQADELGELLRPHLPDPRVAFTPAATPSLSAVLDVAGHEVPL